MELLHIATARSIWLFNPNDLNPRGGAFALDWVQRFVERYSFSTAPTLASLVEASIKNEASQFTNGRFTTSAGIEVAVTLQLYNDGLIAQTRSNTKDSDEFIADLLQWLPTVGANAFFDNFLRKRIYLSELYISSKHSLMLLNPKLESFCRQLSEFIPDGYPKPYQIASIVAAPDSKTDLSVFRFERAANYPFSANRYYSIAPLHTEQHLNLLDLLEDALR